MIYGSVVSFLADLGLLLRGFVADWRAQPFVPPAHDYSPPSPAVISPSPPAIVDPPASADPVEPRILPPAKRLRPPAIKAELKRDVLERLKNYQVYIKRLKRHDPQSYQLYRRVGAFVLRADQEIHTDRLEPGTLHSLPGFGAVALGAPRSDEEGEEPLIHVCFASFLKLARPGYDVERRNGGVIYRCAVYWDDKDRLKWDAGSGVTGEYVIHVDETSGTVTPLRMLKSQEQVIRHKHGADRGTTTTVHHQRWGLPNYVPDHRAQKVTAADHLRFLFCGTMNFWADAATRSMIRVTATKDNIVMPFVVDALETPGFFQDRDVTVDVAGHKKRIFHVVRPHMRGGRAVKLHFRGLSSFTWNGYQIKIVVPGLKVHDITEFTAGGLEDVTPNEISDGMLMEEAADIIADYIGSPSAPDEELAELTARAPRRSDFAMAGDRAA